MQFALINSASLISGSNGATQCNLIAQAIQQQINNDFISVWGLPSASVHFYSGSTVIPTGSYKIYLQNTISDPGYFAFHDEIGLPFARISVQEIFNAGGDVLTGLISVSQEVSHEILEMMVNPDVNLWVSMSADYMTPKEVCDGCESDYYTLTISGSDINVSNFLFPNWFNSSSLDSQFDQLNTTGGYFTMSPGGYMVIRDSSGSKSVIYGSEFPSERLNMMSKRVKYFSEE